MQLTTTFSRQLRFIIHFLGWIVHKITGHDSSNNNITGIQKRSWGGIGWYRITEKITRVGVVHKLNHERFFTPQSVSLNRSIDSHLMVLYLLRLPFYR